MGRGRGTALVDLIDHKQKVGNIANLMNAIAVTNELNENVLYLGEPSYTLPVPLTALGPYETGTFQIVTSEILIGYRPENQPRPATKKLVTTRRLLDNANTSITPGVNFKTSIFAEHRVESVGLYNVATLQNYIDSLVNISVAVSSVFAANPELQEGFHLSGINKIIIGSDQAGWNNAAALAALSSTIVHPWADLTSEQKAGWANFLNAPSDAAAELLWNTLYGNKSGLNFIQGLFIFSPDDVPIIGLPMKQQPS